MRNLIILLICVLAINCFAEPAPSQPDGSVGGYEYVDLGLPSGTLWATYNVGATSPYERGQYFAWGEVEPRENFSWESYKFFKGYEVDPNNAEWVILENIGDNICGTEYDAARYQWGNGWRLPNAQERYELCMLCWTNGSTVENGVCGIRLYGPNEHSIFLPICELDSSNDEPDASHKINALYWIGREDSEYDDNGQPTEYGSAAMSFVVDRYAGFAGATSPKADGLNIRPVISRKEAGINDAVSDIKKVSIVYRNGCIHIFGSQCDGFIKVFDLSGRMTYSGSVVDGTCMLPDLAEGIYLMSYSHNGSIITQKVIIK
ncbi:MAG: T9SS type A sorting domain-containing protein [Muribaculaceae bacterium]|nr:T9SS type A sorting domain-containing protein [Muribaculaceae bacterium]